MNIEDIKPGMFLWCIPIDFESNCRDYLIRVLNIGDRFLRIMDFDLLRERDYPISLVKELHPIAPEKLREHLVNKNRSLSLVTFRNRTVGLYEAREQIAKAEREQKIFDDAIKAMRNQVRKTRSRKKTSSKS